MRRRPIPVAAWTLIASACAAFTATGAHAGGVVTHCNDDAELSNMLVGGGRVTFDCGTATIVLSSTKTITASTTIDGGGSLTLSGDNARRLFVVNAGARLELDDIVIEKGLSRDGHGGAIYNLDTVSISNSQFRNNATTSDWSGGAIFSNSHLVMNNTVFSNNEAGSGGAIYAQSSINQTNIFTTTFDHNFTTNTDSSAGFGGALLLTDGATATVSASILSQNDARQGGAVDARSGSRLFIDGSTISRNSATRDGGGIDIDLSTATLTNVTLSGNSGQQGGAITTFAGEVTLSSVTLSGNSAIYGAGYHTFLGTHTFTNVTFSGNTAQSSGGGIYNSRGTMTLTNVTIANNSGGNGLVGGIVNVGGGPDPHLRLKNVAIAAGTTGANCQFVVPPDSSEFNLSDDDTCNFGTGRDNANLLLGPLADNGGSTLTHLPGPGSAAIGNGTNAGCPPTDQRGVSRPQGLFCEVGSVETGNFTPSPTRTPTGSATRTPSRTATPGQTGVPTASLSPTTTATSTLTDTPTRTSSGTPTQTPTSTPSATFTHSATATPTVSATSTATASVTGTATPSVGTATPSVTGTATPSTTDTATPGATGTATPIDMNTPTPSSTATAPAPLCVGDCDDSGSVAIDDLLIMINIALEQQPPSACRAGDPDRSGRVTIEEILLAVRNALNGCGPSQTQQEGS
jgi:predicted outer membrane repeat protein